MERETTEQGREQQAADAAWMRLAVEEAYKGYGTTSPNPPVGAVIVKDSRLIGIGHHERAGEPHAERMALADARAKGNEALLEGATIYVTLEPCSSYGRTPPCTEAIIQAKLGRVVYGAVDPDERHRGRADALLSAAGILTHHGVENAACGLLLRSWAYAVQNRRPWITAKIAMTMDGRLTRRNTRWLSNEETLTNAHRMRLRSDAIVIGGNTLRTDDPSLTIRLLDREEIPPCKEQPWRIVLTRSAAALPRDRKIFSDAYADRTLVFENITDWEAWLTRLYEERGIVNLMLECGGKLLRPFFEHNLVNECLFDIAPILGGGSDLALPGDFLPTERRFHMEERREVAGNTLLRGTIS